MNDTMQRTKIAMRRPHRSAIQPPDMQPCSCVLAWCAIHVHERHTSALPRNGVAVMTEDIHPGSAQAPVLLLYLPNR
jgi:hypothetical protein